MDVSALEEMLSLTNTVWEQGSIPGEWRHAVVVPILKPGKIADNPESYRPIALTAVILKIMERMVSDRLVYRLEQRGHFLPIEVDLGQVGQHKIQSWF